MTINDDDIDAEEASRNASMLQNKQLLTTNVLMKRKDQLRRWESSEMNAASSGVRPKKRSRVRFPEADVFLSACMSGDEEEVDELLQQGSNINTATIDGLTALHQAVIDCKPEMVEYLIKKGADINAQDNEGWTPLHAAACCGDVAIIKLLASKGSDLRIINSDCELPLDLAEQDSPREFLDAEYRRQNIDLKSCRNAEMASMMADAQRWIKEGKYGDVPHPRNGAYALHVAASKGYTQALELLIRAGADVRCRDKDGWTPLHAAAHWGERDACKILMEHNATIKDRNNQNRDVLDVADPGIIEYLEELEKTAELRRSNPPSSAGANVLQDKNSRISHNLHNHEDHTFTTEHKRELQHRDQSNERDVLFSTLAAKVPRLAEKTPSTDSQSSQESAHDEQMPSERERSSSAATSETASTAASASSAASSASASVTASTASKFSDDRMSVSDRGSSEKSTSPSSMERSPSTNSGASSAVASSPASSSIHSGDQHVSATVPMPRPLQQPGSWINRGVQLTTTAAFSPAMSAAKHHFMTSSVQRSTSIPSNLPWASLCRSSSSGTAPPPSSTEAPTHPSVSSYQFLSTSRVSAFRPPVKTTLTELPRGFEPQTLSPMKMRPWQPTGTSAVNESEAERRSTARLARQNRRSTQGVTKEQLEEATRVASEEAAKRRNNAGTTLSSAAAASSGTSQRENPPIIARLASEERDSSMSVERSNSESVAGGYHQSGHLSSGRMHERDSDRTSPPTPLNSALSLPNALSPSSTPSATNFRRTSKGMPLSRSNRRGTGPVLAEDLAAAVPQIRNTSSSSTSHVEPTSSFTYRYGTATSGAIPPTPVIGRPVFSSVSRVSQPEKSSSVPPSSNNVPSALNLRPSSSTTRAPLPSSARNNATASTSFSSQHQNFLNRPTETNLNYKALYEKEKQENERLRKEMDELRKDSGSKFTYQNAANRLRNNGVASSPTLPKSPSGTSIDEERRVLERRIADLELQLKSKNQLTVENQRLKEENCALVRVISKMTN